MISGRNALIGMLAETVKNEEIIVHRRINYSGGFTFRLRAEFQLDVSDVPFKGIRERCITDN